MADLSEAAATRTFLGLAWAEGLVYLGEMHVLLLPVRVPVGVRAEHHLAHERRLLRNRRPILHLDLVERRMGRRDR